MSNQLGFEQKVQGLVDYYHALDEMDPKNPDHNEIANPSFFYYADGHHVSMPLAEAKNGVLYDMACHALVRYNHWNDNGRGFNLMDLREDTDELRAERADILAVLTAPIKPEIRQERAERIADILANIVAGKTVRLTQYNRRNRYYGTPQEATLDVSRAIFGVFANGHISDRTLTIQYDTPVYSATHENPAEIGVPAVNINIPEIFRSDGLLLEVAA